MKKLLILMFFCSCCYFVWGGDLFQEASLRMRYTRYFNPVYLQENSDRVETRLLPHFLFSKEGFDLSVTPFMGKKWGNVQTSADFDLHELSLFKKWGDVAVTIGRKPLSFEDGSFIGVASSLYKPHPYDLAMVELFDKLSLFLLLEQVDSKIHGHDAEIETYGFYLKDLYSVNLFGYYFTDNRKETVFARMKREDNYLFGFSHSLKNDWLGWRLGAQSVSITPYHGTRKTLFDTMGYLNFEHDFSLFHLSLGGFYAGPFYQNRYQNQDSFGGTLGLLGRTNLMGTSLQLQTKYNLLSLTGAIYSYWRANRNVTLNYADGSKMDYNHSTKKRFVGNELNLNLSYDLSSTFKVKWESGLLLPGDYLKIQTEEKKNMYKTQLYLEGTL